jgi:N-acetylglucosaminyldiphosphoundecaprenol N-acetyl-beta-D-mannosaminyltransferase
MSQPVTEAPKRSQTLVGGLRFHELDERGVIEHVLASWQAGRGGWLVNPNVDVLRQVSADPDIADLASSADLIVADGVPILWAAALQGHPLPGLVAGSDLIWSLSRAAAAADAPVFLLGAAAGVAAQAAANMKVEIPSADPGHYSPPFGFQTSDDEMRKVRERLRAAAPAIVFCGFGFPKQERLMRLLAPEFPGTWFIGTGASISFVAGDVPRAPRALRGSGLEWAFRLAAEPRRLFKRYVVLDAPFAVALLISSARSGRRGRRSTRG